MKNAHDRRPQLQPAAPLTWASGLVIGIGLCFVLIFTVSNVEDDVHYAFHTERTTATVVEVEKTTCYESKTEHPCWQTSVATWQDNGLPRESLLRDDGPSVFVCDDPDGRSLIGHTFTVVYRHNDARPETPWALYFAYAVPVAGFPVAVALIVSFVRRTRARWAVRREQARSAARAAQARAAADRARSAVLRDRARAVASQKAKRRR